MQLSQTTSIYLVLVLPAPPTTNLPVIILLILATNDEFIRYKFFYYPINSDYSSWRSRITPRNFQNTRYSL